MDQELLSILACPQCKGKLVYDEQTSELICWFEKLAYPVHEGQIPVLLPTQARSIT